MAKYAPVLFKSFLQLCWGDDDGDGNDDYDGGTLLRAIMCDCGDDCNCVGDQAGDPLDGG